MGTERSLQPVFLVYCLIFLLLAPAGVLAQDGKVSGVTDRVADLLKSDIYRVSVGGANVRLNNPEGFDTSSNTYRSGQAESNAIIGGTFTWSLTGESKIGWEGRGKRLWSLHFDSEDFTGLKLQSLMLGGGWSFDPASRFAFGARLAGGLGAGLTRSSTFFDSAIHPSFEAWVSAGIQLGRVTLDLSLRQRKALGATLDERSASPATRVISFTYGWLI
ncbi:MAG: hypothetical protein KTR32_36055 [Granulosicoccus sp.]|nr:hypothetical protein [Granulosicoccus sp.]